MDAKTLKDTKVGMTRILTKIQEDQFWQDPQILSAASNGVVNVETAKLMVAAFNGDMQAAKSIHDTLRPGVPALLSYAGQNIAREWMADTLQAAMDALLTVEVSYDDIIELDWYDGPILFLSKKIPGAEGRQYQAILIDKTPDPVYAAVEMENRAEVDAIVFTADYKSDEYNAMMAKFRAQFEGKDCIKFMWNDKGFVFMDAHVFPEEMLPGDPPETSEVDALSV